jgi:WbqC-like protein family
MVTRATTSDSFQQSASGGVSAGRTVVASHQPNYIPWLGYFFKIAHAAKFIFVDMVMFPDPGFVNRNVIKTQNGTAWLTIPVHRSGRAGQLISEVETDNVQPWVRRHVMALRTSYGRAPYFKEIFALLEPHYGAVTGRTSSLAEFNLGLIRAIAAYLGIDTEWIRASQLSVDGPKTDLVVSICNAMGADTYLAGTGAKAYLENEKLENAGIALVYSPFTQARYPQLFGDFVSNLSIVDVLMNCGAGGTRRLLGIEAVSLPKSA